MKLFDYKLNNFCLNIKALLCDKFARVFYSFPNCSYMYIYADYI